MPPPSLSSIRVIRYAPDGGHSAREWLKAFGALELPPVISDGESFRIGVQITKKRAIDVIVRIEALGSVGDRLRGRFGRTQSDSLFRNRKACRRHVPGASRPLAVLAARHAGRPIRILVCQPKQD